MPRKLKYEVKLSKTQREYLETYIRAGEHSTRLLNRVRVLLLADRGEFGPGWIDKQNIEAVGVSNFTVYKLREKFCKVGLEKTIQRKKYDNSNRDRKIDGDAEAPQFVGQRFSPVGYGAAGRIRHAQVLQRRLYGGRYDVDNAAVPLALHSGHHSLGQQVRGNEVFGVGIEESIG